MFRDCAYVKVEKEIALFHLEKMHIKTNCEASTFSIKSILHTWLIQVMSYWLPLSKKDYKKRLGGGGSLFVVVSCHSNSISVLSWRWYNNVWDEKEKPRAYTFTDDSRVLLPPTPCRHGMRVTGLWCRCMLYTAGKWIAAQLNVIAVTGIRTPVPTL